MPVTFRYGFGIGIVYYSFHILDMELLLVSSVKDHTTYSRNQSKEPFFLVLDYATKSSNSI